MRPQSTASSSSFSSLVAGSSRRRRVMMNELVVQRLDIPDNAEQTEQQETQENHSSVNNSDFESWVTSLDNEPVKETTEKTVSHQTIEADVTSETNKDLFSKLASLSEPEQISEEEITTGNSQFDDLLEQKPELADVVNSFESEKVQQEVMTALVNAYEQEQALIQKTTETQ